MELHKNSMERAKEFRIRDWLILYNYAESINGSKARWSEKIEEGKIRYHIFTLNKTIWNYGRTEMFYFQLIVGRHLLLLGRVYE